MFEELTPGTRVDDFTVAYRIARGMCADIYGVWHHTLRTPLVCKRLRPRDERQAKWRRLLREEGRALRRLDHPGIVRLVAAEEKKAVPYLLLEHAGDWTLRDHLLKSGRLEIGHAIRIVQHTGAAVTYMHERGYLHRDLKPSNLIVRQGRVVLLDFGVVWKWRQKRLPPDRSGTPQYLAPEQINRQALTPATDVFGLACLLYELLAGRRPFARGPRYDDYQAPLAERYEQLSVDPPALSSHEVDAPPKLQRVMNKALSRRAQSRYQTVPELLDALDPFTTIKIWPQVSKRPGGPAARIKFSES